MSKVTFEATLAVAGVPTMNGHVYSQEALEKAVKVFNDRVERRGGALHGELAMPRLQRANGINGKLDIEDTFYIDEKHVSHVYNAARMDEGSMKVSVVLLDTPDGKLIEEFMERTAKGTQPVFAIRAHLPEGVKRDNITDLVPISVDIVNVA